MPIPRTPPKMFETRSQAWQEVGLLQQVSPRAVKRARVEALFLVALFAVVVALYDNRVSLLGTAGGTARRRNRSNRRSKRPCAPRRSSP